MPVGDFAFYDQVLDMSFTLGNLPERVRGFHGDALDNYFRVARGRSAKSAEEQPHCCGGVAAGEMTKWFDTNYHYIVPEFSAATEFKLDPSRLLEQLAEAKAQGVKAKPVIVGPVTYLWLGKAKDDSDKLASAAAATARLRRTAGHAGGARCRMGTDRRACAGYRARCRMAARLQLAYHHLKACRVKLLLATYFGAAAGEPAAGCQPARGWRCTSTRSTPRTKCRRLLDLLPSDKVLSLGVINGRNIWKTDLNAVLDWLRAAARTPGRASVDRTVVLAAARAGRSGQRAKARQRGQVLARFRAAEAR